MTPNDLLVTPNAPSGVTDALLRTDPLEASRLAPPLAAAASVRSLLDVFAVTRGAPSSMGTVSETGRGRGPLGGEAHTSRAPIATRLRSLAGTPSGSGSTSNGWTTRRSRNQSARLPSGLPYFRRRPRSSLRCGAARRRSQKRSVTRCATTRAASNPPCVGPAGSRGRGARWPSRLQPATSRGSAGRKAPPQSRARSAR